MRACAICREHGRKFSAEHVIPEALGGHYVLRDLVCVDCNSRLGAQVDDKLVNQLVTRMYRHTHDLRGKGEKASHPFTGTFALTSDPGRKARVKVASDGGLVPYLLPKVERTEVDGGVRVSISVDATDEAKVEPMFAKITERMGIPADRISPDAERTRISGHVSLMGKGTVDIRDFQIGVLKIAYEFAIDRVPSYFESDEAKQTAHILGEAKLDDVEQYVNIGDGFGAGLLDGFADFLDFGRLKHYLVLCGTADSLLCFVHFDGFISFGVTLSTQSFGEFVQFGVNDVRRRSFKVFAPEDLTATRTYRPQLHFRTAEDMVRFHRAEMASDFDYETENGYWKLFRHDGTYTGLCLDGLIKALQPIRSALHSGCLIDEYRLPEGLFLRPRGWTEQVEVCAIRAERVCNKL